MYQALTLFGGSLTSDIKNDFGWYLINRKLNHLRSNKKLEVILWSGFVFDRCLEFHPFKKFTT